MEYDTPNNNRTFLEEIKEAPSMSNTRSSQVQSNSTDEDMDVVFQAS